ncbi:MAG: hypothetical protein PF501_15660 [Salinisphaera sp.]|jgi:ATP synthase protein I|nr:hypothetical protein [Salinisphaera sp.]
MGKVLVRLLTIQALVGLVIAAGFFVYAGLGGAVAAIFGVFIGLGVTLLLGWRMARASRSGVSLAPLMMGAAERMLFVCVAFGVGIAWLRLAPVAILVGFMGAECSYYVLAGPMRRYMVASMGRQANGD